MGMLGGQFRRKYTLLSVLPWAAQAQTALTLGSKRYPYPASFRPPIETSREADREARERYMDHTRITSEGVGSRGQGTSPYSHASTPTTLFIGGMIYAVFHLQEYVSTLSSGFSCFGKITLIAPSIVYDHSVPGEW
ncbi:hypothetical protein NMY22_g16746 [Coprinellus aureogranulatus]|nr:hypothetical protein NMY22_g16746 [Coprinellus aureogranulatus]